MNHQDSMKKLLARTISDAVPLSRQQRGYYESPKEPFYIRDELGVRRISETSIEIDSGGKLVKSAYGSAIGVLFVMGLGISTLMLMQTPSPIPADMWLFSLLSPLCLAAFGGLLYASTRNVRGGYVRLNRKTRKIYYVFPHNQQLAILDWDEVQPMAGYVPIVGAAGYTNRHPLCLVGTDWTQSPPQEVPVSCGNLGWRDQGKSARELWGYMQCFMENGPQGLPAPPPLPPQMSRKQTFLYGYRQWALKFREDLSTPRGKRWALLWAPAKVLWLVTIVFPDSIGEYLDYTLPEVQFPKEIDELCEFESEKTSSHRCKCS